MEKRLESVAEVAENLTNKSLHGKARLHVSRHTRLHGNITK